MREMIQASFTSSRVKVGLEGDGVVCVSTLRSISTKRPSVVQYVASWGNDDVLVSGCSRGFEVRVVPRQDPKGLKCDAKVPNLIRPVV